jgi:hypothetical protein
MFIKITSYIQNPDYAANDTGIITKNAMVEQPCILNDEEILFIFPTNNTVVGKSQIKLRNGSILTAKESLDELEALLIPDLSNFLGTKLN